MPDGENITLNLFDLVRGASISRTVVTRDIPVLDLDLSTEQGTVARWRQLHLRALSRQSRWKQCPNAGLTVVIPEGATFISADGTFVVNGDQITWDLGTLGPEAMKGGT